MKAKKSLGQNFLTSQSAVEKIVRAGELSDKDTVVEIGPGKGALTKALLATGAHVIAIEKDDDLVPFLKNLFSTEIATGQFELVHGDILTANSSQLTANPYKLIANIPYNITGEIIRMFLTAAHQPERMVVLVQKEVAERIVARDGKESILSISVKAFGTPKLIATVSAGSFSPKPNVDSAILAITNLSRKTLSIKKEKQFFEYVKQGFSQKRKQLVSTLSPLMDRESIVAFLLSRKLPATARAEELRVDDWVALTAHS